MHTICIHLNQHFGKLALVHDMCVVIPQKEDNSMKLLLATLTGSLVAMSAATAVIAEEQKTPAPTQTVQQQENKKTTPEQATKESTPAPAQGTAPAPQPPAQSK